MVSTVASINRRKKWRQNSGIRAPPPKTYLGRWWSPRNQASTAGTAAWQGEGPGSWQEEEGCGQPAPAPGGTPGRCETVNASQGKEDNVSGKTWETTEKKERTASEESREHAPGMNETRTREAW